MDGLGLGPAVDSFPNWFYCVAFWPGGAEKVTPVTPVTEQTVTLSPFGCVVQVAHTLPIGAVGLKTAGVTRPASQFKVN